MWRRAMDRLRRWMDRLRWIVLRWLLPDDALVVGHSSWDYAMEQLAQLTDYVYHSGGLRDPRRIKARFKIAGLCHTVRTNFVKARRDYE